MQEPLINLGTNPDHPRRCRILYLSRTPGDRRSTPEKATTQAESLFKPMRKSLCDRALCFT